MFWGRSVSPIEAVAGQGDGQVLIGKSLQVKGQVDRATCRLKIRVRIGVRATSGASSSPEGGLVNSKCWIVCAMMPCIQLRLSPCLRLSLRVRLRVRVRT